MDKTTQELIDLIEQTTGNRYTGKIEVRFDEPDFWSLFLYLNTEYTPIILSYQGNYDQFKQYIQKELKTRKLEKNGFYKIDLVYNGCKNDCNEQREGN